MKILFVCTGNVCRSPMAEGFLRHEAQRRDLDIEVKSTGTHAWSGRAATIDGRRVMNEHGVSIDDHRTIELDQHLVDWADLIIGSTGITPNDGRTLSRSSRTYSSSPGSVARAPAPRPR